MIICHDISYIICHNICTPYRCMHVFAHARTCVCTCSWERPGRNCTCADSRLESSESNLFLRILPAPPCKIPRVSSESSMLMTQADHALFTAQHVGIEARREAAGPPAARAALLYILYILYSYISCISCIPIYPVYISCIYPVHCGRESFPHGRSPARAALAAPAPGLPGLRDQGRDRHLIRDLTIVLTRDMTII